MQTDATTDAWLRARGIVPDPEFWVLDVALTTTDAENKLYARKNLRPEDVTLELTLYGSGSWNVTCVRHDGTYRARWDRHRQPEVEAQALKYRRFLKWPTVDGPDDFPALVPKLEALLDIRFRRHVNVNGDRLDEDGQVGGALSVIQTFTHEDGGVGERQGYKFTFLGGTALRLCYGTERFSEPLAPRLP